jgi:hypothetical protein
MITSFPFLARFNAMSLPRPRLPPVTRAILLFIVIVYGFDVTKMAESGFPGIATINPRFA